MESSLGKQDGSVLNGDEKDQPHLRTWVLPFIIASILFSSILLVSRSLHPVTKPFSSEVDGDEMIQLKALKRTKQNPNIILILIDDQGFNDMGYSSSDALSECTPFIDSLAESGVKLTNYYAQSVCTPSRASLLTGKYPIHIGMQHSHIKGTQPWGLPLDQMLLPEYLDGYEKVIVGKWHLGHYSNKHTPLERGFNHFYGFYSGATDYYSHMADIKYCTLYNRCYYDFRDDNEIVSDKLNMHSSYLFDEEVQNILSSHDISKPLFLYYSLQMVHSPMEVPDEVVEANAHILDKIPSELRKGLAGLSIMTDSTVKNVVETLKEKRMYDNSVIIVASDNGANPSAGSNHPYRGMKGFLYEGAYKVNAFIHSPLLPSKVQGTTYDGLFHVSDWFPTIISGVLGKTKLVDDLSLDGIDQWQAILGNLKKFPRDEILYNSDDIDQHGAPLGYTKGAIRVGDWKLILNEVEDGWYPPATTTEGYLIEPSMFDYQNLKTYLFNLKEDPFELKDQKKKEPEIYQKLLKKFNKYSKNASPCVFCSLSDEAAFEHFDANERFVGPWVDVFDEKERSHCEILQQLMKED